jgi:hypothetical protein
MTSLADQPGVARQTETGPLPCGVVRRSRMI